MDGNVPPRTAGTLMRKAYAAIHMDKLHPVALRACIFAFLT